MYQKTAAAPRMARAAMRRRGLWRLVLLGIMLVIFASYVSPLRTYMERNTQIKKEQQVVEELRLQHQTLLDEKEKLQNHGYVEQVARRDLGLVRPGEQPFVLKDLNKEESGETAVKPPATEEGSLAGRVMEWVGSILP